MSGAGLWVTEPEQGRSGKLPCVSLQGPARPKGDLGAKGQQGIPTQGEEPQGCLGSLGDCSRGGAWGRGLGLCISSCLFLHQRRPHSWLLSLGVELVPRRVYKGCEAHSSKLAF